MKKIPLQIIIRFSDEEKRKLRKMGHLLNTYILPIVGTLGFCCYFYLNNKIYTQRENLMETLKVINEFPFYQNKISQINQGMLALKKEFNEGRIDTISYIQKLDSLENLLEVYMNRR